MTNLSPKLAALRIGATDIIMARLSGLKVEMPKSRENAKKGRPYGGKLRPWAIDYLDRVHGPIEHIWDFAEKFGLNYDSFRNEVYAERRRREADRNTETK